MGFAIDRIRGIYDEDSRSTQTQRPKCVGLYFHSDSNLMVLVYEMRVVVYDYVLGTITESVDCREPIASFMFYNGSLFCGCKTSVITKVRLKSFPSMGTTTIVRKAASELKLQKVGRLKGAAREVMRPSVQLTIANRRKAEAHKPVVDWKRGDREFTVKFNGLKK